MIQDNLCKTSTGIDAKMLIISDEISTHVDYSDWLRLYMWKDARDRHFLQSEVKK